MEEDVYAYIRARQGDEVGFSVLDKIHETRKRKYPDFTIMTAAGDTILNAELFGKHTKACESSKCHDIFP